MVPHYDRPQVAIPAEFKEAPGWRVATPSDAVARGAWWQLFADPVLDDLENRVARNNQNIAAALAAYDQARAALPERLDEVLFQNERGEVCDGSISTVCFDRGQGMRTPPLTSGLLPGVLRAEMGCPEEVLLAADLPQVQLWIGNALRGLIPGIFCP